MTDASTDDAGRKKQQSAMRMFRRFRSWLRAELGIEKLTEADLSLLNEAALLALREKQMRDAILSGAGVPDVDLIRLTNALRRVREELRKSATAKVPTARDNSDDWIKAQEEGLAKLQEDGNADD